MRDRNEARFRRLVHTLYPEAFASQFADEMAGVFAEGYEDARTEGRFRALLFLARELASLAAGALVEQAADRSPRRTALRRTGAAFARLLDSPLAPVLLALIGLGTIGGLSSELVATRGLYWRATQLALVALLAGVALHLGRAIARDPRAIVRSVAVARSTLFAALGIAAVALADDAVSLASALRGASYDASLPGIHLRVATGDKALAGKAEPPAGLQPTRWRSASVEHGGLAVRTQLFARGVDLAYALVAISLLCLGGAGGFRLERNRHRLT